MAEVAAVDAPEVKEPEYGNHARGNGGAHPTLPEQVERAVGQPYEQQTTQGVAAVHRHTGFYESADQSVGVALPSGKAGDLGGIGRRVVIDHIAQQKHE